MNGATSADLLAAHRWTRDRVLEALLCAPGAGEDSSPSARNGLVLGPVVALVVAVVAVWGADVQVWVQARLG